MQFFKFRSPIADPFWVQCLLLLASIGYIVLLVFLPLAVVFAEIGRAHV